MVLIKKRNFKPYLLDWLIPKLGVGMAIGNIYHMAVAGSAMEQRLKDNGVPDSEIFHTLAAAEDATKANQNDVICAAPGLYTETVMTTWDKANTHLVGLGGPANRGYVGAGRGVEFYTETVTVVAIVHLSGPKCQFHDATFANNGAASACLTSFQVNSYGEHLKNCQFMGVMNDTQGAVSGASSLEIQQGTYLLAKGCTIGSTEWGLYASNTNAPLLFSNASGSGPSDGRFVACKIQHYQAATTRPLIYCASYGMDRDWVFDRCEFYSFSVNHATVCAQIITKAAYGQTHDVLFKDCAGYNVTAYKTASDGCTWASGGGAAAAKTGVAVVTT